MKTKTIFSASLSLFLLCGCTSTATISNGDEVLFTVGDTSYTRQQEYQAVKNASGASITMELIYQAILDEEIGVDEEIENEANEAYESLASENEDFEAQLIEKGYQGKEDYINKVLIPDAQKDRLMDKYFKDNADEIQKEYKPTVAKLLMCDNKNDAENALQALKDGTDEQTVWDTYVSDSATYGNEEIVVSTLLEDTLPTYIINSLYKQDEEGLVDEVLDPSEESSDGFYYVAIITGKDYEENLETIENAFLSSNQEALETECFVYYLKKYDFEVHDQEIFDYLRANNPEYLVSYPELAKEQEEE